MNICDVDSINNFFALTPSVMGEQVQQNPQAMQEIFQSLAAHPAYMHSHPDIIGKGLSLLSREELPKDITDIFLRALKTFSANPEERKICLLQRDKCAAELSFLRREGDYELADTYITRLLNLFPVEAESVEESRLYWEYLCGQIGSANVDKVQITNLLPLLLEHINERTSALCENRWSKKFLQPAHLHHLLEIHGLFSSFLISKGACVKTLIQDSPEKALHLLASWESRREEGLAEMRKNGLTGEAILKYLLHDKYAFFFTYNIKTILSLLKEGVDYQGLQATIAEQLPLPFHQMSSDYRQQDNWLRQRNLVGDFEFVAYYLISKTSGFISYPYRGSDPTSEYTRAFAAIMLSKMSLTTEAMDKWWEIILVEKKYAIKSIVELVNRYLSGPAVDPERLSALLKLVCKEGHPDVVAALISQGAKLDHNATILHVAGDPSIIAYGLTQKIDINAIDDEGYTPLLRALKDGRIDTAQALLNGKADCSYRAPDGNSVLSLAAYCPRLLPQIIALGKDFFTPQEKKWLLLSLMDKKDFSKISDLVNSDFIVFNKEITVNENHAKTLELIKRRAERVDYSDFLYIIHTGIGSEGTYHQVQELFKAIASIVDPLLKSKVQSICSRALCVNHDWPNFYQKLGGKPEMVLYGLLFSFYGIPSQLDDEALKSLGKWSKKDYQYLQVSRPIMKLLLTIDEVPHLTRPMRQSVCRLLLQAHTSAETRTAAQALTCLLYLKVSESNLLACKELSAVHDLVHAKTAEVLALPSKAMQGEWQNTIGQWKSPEDIAILASRYATLRKVDQERALQGLQKFVCRVMEGTFHTERYNLSTHHHLSKVFSDCSELLESWKRGQEQDFSTFLKTMDGLHHVEGQSVSSQNYLYEKLVVDNHLGGLLTTACKESIRQPASEAYSSLMERIKEQLKNLAIELKHARKDGVKKVADLQREQALLQLQRLLLLISHDNKPLTEEVERLQKLLHYVEQLSPGAEFLQDVTGLLATLAQAPSSQKYQQRYQGWKIIDGDDPETLLRLGSGVVGSCQRVDGDAKLNKCLVSYLLDGKIRYCAILDGEGNLVARRLLRLLINKNGKPALFKERLYSNQINDPYISAALDSFFVQRAQLLGCPLYTSESDQEKGTTSSETLQSLGGAPDVFWEYVDAQPIHGQTAPSYTLTHLLQL